MTSRFGVDGSALSAMRGYGGGGERKPRTVLRPCDREPVIAAYRDTDETIASIAARFDVSHACVGLIARKAGLPHRRPEAVRRAVSAGLKRIRR